MINQFTITSIPIAVNSDIRFNILKRRELIKYQTNIDNNLVNLSYVISKELFSTESVFISDRSTDLVANRVPELINAIIFNAKTISLSVDKFLVTDIFIGDIERVPLFWKHVLKNFDQQIIHEFSIKDQNFNTTNTQDVILDKQNGILYSNLQNSSEQFFYISYSVGDGNSISSFVELLDNEPIFRLATIEDLDDEGNLDIDNKVYLIDQFASNFFEIQFSKANLYAVKEDSAAKIKLLLPPKTTNDNPWFVSVTNGNFLTTLYLDSSTPSLFQYNLPEFETQIFNPEFPFKFKELEVATQVDTKVLQTLKRNIDSSKFIDVILRNPDRSIRYAFTTNTSKIGLPFENSVVFQNGIRSIDRQNGLIDLIISIKDTDIIETSYYYSEDQLEIIDINFNPIQNSFVLGKQIIFYIVPNTNRTKTLFYLVADKRGIIEFGNQIDNQNLLDDIETGSFYFDTTSNSFLQKYTVQASALNSYKYFILGSVFVSNRSSVSNSVLFDVRKRGGGLIKDRIKELAEINPEVMFCADIGNWDGIPYPGNGSVLVEVPVYLNSQNGGLFSESEIIQTVERHMAFGIYPIVRGYGLDIKPTLEVYG